MKKSLYDHCIENKQTHLLSQWQPEKNNGISPHDVSSGSHYMAWWRCEHGHEWQTSVFHRAVKGTGCPFCANRLPLPGVNTLADVYPELVSQWHPTKNEGLSPTDILPGTQRKVWWICEKGHEWEAGVRSRTRGHGCPVCSNRVLRVGENDLASAAPELAAQWHPTKNGNLTPADVMVGTHRKIWWICEKGHEWQASVNARSNCRGCPACDGKQVVPGENDLESNYPHIAAQWHSARNGALTPHDVTVYSNRKVWWICEKGHEYTAYINARTQSNSGCPYCSGHKVLVGFNDLATIYPKIAEQWYQPLNGTLTPEMVTSGSNKKVWWQCDEDHIWTAVISSRTGPRKHGCPVCARKGNTKNVKCL